MIDILIIGGGPAGLTAAIYAARAGRTVTVCEKETLGGQITQSHQVDNYPGLPRISGMELSDAFCAQAMDAGAEIAFASVESIVRNLDGTFTAETDDEPITAKAVILLPVRAPDLWRSIMTPPSSARASAIAPYATVPSLRERMWLS